MPPLIRSRAVTLVLMAIAAAVVLAGCVNAEEGSGSTEVGIPEVLPLRIGTLPTEDALPLWAAEKEGLFAEQGLDEVEIVTFQSAQERDAALLAGSIDAFMGDIIAAAQLEAAGTPVSIATVMLGSTPSEGRFGVVATPGSERDSMSDLAEVPVGTSSGTIQEYVLDGLMREAGVSADRVVKEEVKKVPVRFDLLMNGRLEAAALPEPLLTLAVSQGAVLVADDSGGENLSQTVLVVADEFTETEAGARTLERLLTAWDEGAAAVNAEPDAWRETLVEQARLPAPIKDTYAVQRYPEHQLPSREQVEEVLSWMRGEGLLEVDLSYDDLVVGPAS